VKLTDGEYWRLRCALLQIAQQQAALAALQAEARRQMQAAGLDPDAEYRLDDTTCTAVPQGRATVTETGETP
jgi:hypothetical protein